MAVMGHSVSTLIIIAIGIFHQYEEAWSGHLRLATTTRDIEYGTRGKGAFVTRKPADHPGDLMGLSQPPHRNSREHLLDVIWRQVMS